MSQEPEELVRDAASGDEVAWRRLVARYGPLMWYVARGYRLSDAQCSDAVATAWLRLVENIGSLRDARHVAAWLTTTVRRECLAQLREDRREQPVEDLAEGRPDVLGTGIADSPDKALLEAERQGMVRRALTQLPEHWQQLLVVLSTLPEMSYADVAAALNMPVGSIGPTRARALHRLRELLVAAEDPATASVG